MKECLVKGVNILVERTTDKSLLHAPSQDDKLKHQQNVNGQCTEVPYCQFLSSKQTHNCHFKQKNVEALQRITSHNTSAKKLLSRHFLKRLNDDGRRSTRTTMTLCPSKTTAWTQPTTCRSLRRWDVLKDRCHR